MFCRRQYFTKQAAKRDSCCKTKKHWKRISALLIVPKQLSHSLARTWQSIGHCWWQLVQSSWMAIPFYMMASAFVLVDMGTFFRCFFLIPHFPQLAPYINDALSVHNLKDLISFLLMNVSHLLRVMHNTPRMHLSFLFGTYLIFPPEVVEFYELVILYRIHLNGGICTARNIPWERRQFCLCCLWNRRKPDFKGQALSAQVCHQTIGMLAVCTITPCH